MYFKPLKFLVVLSVIILCISCRKDIDTFKDEEIEISPPDLKLYEYSVNESIGGYMVALPSQYSYSHKKYPLLISIHGAGQFGSGNTDDMKKLFYSGIPSLLSNNKFPPSIKVNQQYFSFVVLAPQFKHWPSNYDVKEFIDFAKSAYSIDSTRIYLTGLSMGGTVTCDVGSEFTMTLAAILPMSGISIMGADIEIKCKNIAAGRLPVWLFHNEDDFQINSKEPKQYIELINSFKPEVPVKITLFHDIFHDSWTRATSPTYRENSENIYEWMLKFHR